MNKHQAIRSITVLLLIALISTLSNSEPKLFIFQPSENISINQFNWHEDATSEIELQQLQNERELTACVEIVTELKTLEDI